MLKNLDLWVTHLVNETVSRVGFDEEFRCY